MAEETILKIKVDKTLYERWKADNQRKQHPTDLAKFLEEYYIKNINY